MRFRFSIYDLFVAYLMASLNIFRFSKRKRPEYFAQHFSAYARHCSAAFQSQFHCCEIFHQFFFLLLVCILFRIVQMLSFALQLYVCSGTLTLHLFYYTLNRIEYDTILGQHPENQMNQPENSTIQPNIFTLIKYYIL